MSLADGVGVVVPKEYTVFRFAVPPAPPTTATSTSTSTSAEDGSRGDSSQGTTTTTTTTTPTTTTTEEPLVFELHGSQFLTRAPDRANKKFKHHYDPDL